MSDQISAWNRIGVIGHQWAIPVLLFLMPLHKHVLPPFIVASFLFHCLFAKRKDITLNLSRYKMLALPVLLFIAYVVGMIYTENTSTGWFKVEVKLSFLIFPIMMILRPGVNRVFMVRCVKALILGSCATIGISLGMAFDDYLVTKDLASFTYVNASFFVHTSYLAMYLNFSLLVLIYSVVRSNLLGWNRWVIGLIAISFILYIMLLVSKTGLITLCFTFIVVLGLSLFRSARPKAAVLILVLFVVLVIGSYYSLDFVKLRVDELVWYFRRGDWLDNSSMAVRAWTWSSAWEMLKESMWLGYGTGDVQDTLSIAYGRHELTKLHLEHNLNAHNQFLESALALGIMIPIGMIISGMALTIRWLRNKMWFGAGFLLLVGINFTTESMLEAQAGNVFIGLFLALFIAIAGTYQATSKKNTVQHG